MFYISFNVCFRLIYWQKKTIIFCIPKTIYKYTNLYLYIKASHTENVKIPNRVNLTYVVLRKFIKNYNFHLFCIPILNFCNIVLYYTYIYWPYFYFIFFILLHFDYHNRNRLGRNNIFLPDWTLIVLLFDLYTYLYIIYIENIYWSISDRCFSEEKKSFK